MKLTPGVTVLPLLEPLWRRIGVSPAYNDRAFDVCRFNDNGDGYDL